MLNLIFKKIQIFALHHLPHSRRARENCSLIVRRQSLVLLQRTPRRPWWMLMGFLWRKQNKINKNNCKDKSACVVLDDFLPKNYLNEKELEIWINSYSYSTYSNEAKNVVRLILCSDRYSHKIVAPPFQYLSKRWKWCVVDCRGHRVKASNWNYLRNGW